MMKDPRTKRLAKAFIAFCLLASIHAHAAIYSWTSGTLNSQIPDGNPAGISSTIMTSGMVPTLTDVDVVLNVAGTYNGDLYAYLVHGNTGFAVLLNRVGKTSINPFGYGDPGFSITLSDQGTLDIHGVNGSGSLVTGTYQPDGRNVDPSSVLDTSSRTAMLSSFNNQDPNGAWTIFFADMAGGEQSSLVSWSLQITAIPEPANIALAGFAGIVSMTWLYRRLRRGKIAGP